MSRGGKRLGAGGKKPKLPDELKKKSRTIRMRDPDWTRIKKSAQSSGMSIDEYILYLVNSRIHEA